MKIYFNSHDIFYKQPFGAAKTGDTVKFRLSVFAEAPPREVFLRLWQDGAERLIPMQLESEVGGEFTFSATAEMPSDAMLIWYHFIVHVQNGEVLYYGNNSEYLGGEGLQSSNPPEHSYQITVYDKDFAVPSWFKDGIMYQIFVDRFARGSAPAATGEHGSPLQKHYYQNWHDPMEFQQHLFEDGNAANDFYGGDLQGVIDKLPYLKSLNVSIIYFNPIFEAYSNHKYDTADYKNIDRGFGDNETFSRLCAEAEKLGIRIVLDGVFSHVGSDSVYFNKYSTYGENVGAYRDENSPYREWFEFGEGNSYESWWGCTTLPNVLELTPSYLDYILRDDDSVVKLWLERGASGWRLDVADELPPEFLKILRREIKAKAPNAIILGEVWEDASNKRSYDVQREYLLGGELDTVMNYPFKDNLLAFVLRQINADTFARRMMSIFENYPRDVAFALMNLVGGHDVARLRTALGEMYDDPNVGNSEKQFWKLSPEMAELARQRQKLVALAQMAFVGVPCVYYGDEIGMEGLRDPHNRKPMEWDNLDDEMLLWYRRLMAIRAEREVLRSGEIEFVHAQDGVLAFVRHDEKEKLLCVINRGDEKREIDISNLVGANRVRPMINNDVDDGRTRFAPTIKLKISSLGGGIYELSNGIRALVEIG